MKYGYVFALAFLVALSCSKPEQPRLEPLTNEEISGERLWRRISEESDFEHWAYWPGHEELRPGQSPHGKFHEVYINYTLEEALPIKEKVVPQGSIIVKESFNSEKKLTNLTVMAKVEGYNPEYNDWFWARYEPDGKVSREGKVMGCINCHAGMKQNDYVIIRRLDASLP